MSERAGRYGRFGGRYVAETLVAPLEELEAAYAKAKGDAKFQEKLARELRLYVGRPTPITPADRLTERCGGARIF
jgi:tryptophan synthase beta chain